MGAKRSDNPGKQLSLINELCERLHDIYAWDARAAEQFADLLVLLLLLKQGIPIGGNDTIIAAHALSFEATLVTNIDFGKVLGLNIVNWKRPSSISYYKRS